MKYQFKIGQQMNYTGLFGGNQHVTVIDRTKHTITLQKSWISEDTGIECFENEVHDIELEAVKNSDTFIERIAVWEYRGSYGYLYCLADNEIDEIYNNIEKENTDMTTFTLNNIEYTKQSNGYCYKIEDGKKSRIPQKTFDRAQQEANEQKLDTAAENPEVSVEEFEQMIAETEESNTTEQIEETAKELAPKAKKRTNKRVSKNIAWGKIINGVDVSLTAKQVDFIRHLPDTCFWEQGLDSCVWTDVLADEIGGQFAGKPMTTGAMISTICEKGLGVRAKNRVNKRMCTSFQLTDLGKLVAAELGLN